MNKRIYLFFILCIFGVCPCWTETKGLSKSAMKSYKIKCMQLKKEGWKVLGDETSVDDALMKYYLQNEAGGDNVITVVGIGQDPDVNTAYAQAQHRASVSLASKRGVRVENLTVVKLSNSSEVSTNEMHSINYAQAEQILRSQKPVASLYRKVADGTTEINLYYIIR